MRKNENGQVGQHVCIYEYTYVYIYVYLKKLRETKSLPTSDILLLKFQMHRI